MKRLLALTVLLGGLLQGAAFAQAPATNTLDEVVRRGRVDRRDRARRAAHGMTNAQMQPDGLDVDIARALARDMASSSRSCRPPRRTAFRTCRPVASTW